jgi:hypothetical protein
MPADIMLTVAAHFRPATHPRARDLPPATPILLPFGYAFVDVLVARAW